MPTIQVTIDLPADVLARYDCREVRLRGPGDDFFNGRIAESGKGNTQYGIYPILTPKWQWPKQVKYAAMARDSHGMVAFFNDQQLLICQRGNNHPTWESCAFTLHPDACELLGITPPPKRDDWRDSVVINPDWEGE